MIVPTFSIMNMNAVSWRKKIGENELKMTHQKRSQRNQLKKNLPVFCNAAKKAMIKQLHKLNCVN